MYGEGQGDVWWDAQWQLDAEGRIIVQVKEGASQTYQFDARDVKQLVLRENGGGGLVIPRVRPPN